MGFRFRKSIKIAPGLWLNISKRGQSLSIGGRSSTTNISKRGIRQTFGIPGIGLSYSRMVGKGKQRDSRKASSRVGLPAGNGTRGAGSKLVLGCVLVLVVILTGCAGVGSGNEANSGATPTSAASPPPASPKAVALMDTPAPSLLPSPASSSALEEPLQGDAGSDTAAPIAAAMPVGSPSSSGAGRAQPVGSDCPPDFQVKGNINRKGDHIYHVPGDSSYRVTKPEAWFATASDAADAGFRAPIS